MRFLKRTRRTVWYLSWLSKTIRHPEDMAVLAPIFRWGVAPNWLGADVLKLRQKFGAYMGPPPTVLTQN